MTYKGYVGLAEIDDEAGVLRGRVINTRDTITFQGATVEEARKAFVESVDDYLAFCGELGEEPEKPFSGRFLVRLKPEVHRDLNLIAQVKGVSVNRLVTRELGRFVGRQVRAIAGLKEPAPRKAKPAGRAAKAKGSHETKRAKEKV
jgi:predicted HicB family RNase H-like nuclease